MGKPLIPDGLKDEFIGTLAHADDDDLADGAWFAMLEEAAERFIKKHKLRVDANDAVHYYFELTSGK